MYKELVEYIVKGLVEHPDDVSVSEVVNGKSVLVEVKVADVDTGRVIGKRGRVINAIRTVSQVRGSKEGKKIAVELI